MSRDFCRGGRRVYGRLYCRDNTCTVCVKARGSFTTRVAEGSERDRYVLMDHVNQRDTAHGQPREDR